MVDAILAIDVGTTAVKVTLVDSDLNVLSAHTSIEYTTTTTVSRIEASGVAEQDPNDWWAATCETTAQAATIAARDGFRVVAISLCGQMQDVILVSGGHETSGDGPLVLRPALLYSDSRATQEAKELEDMAGGEKGLIQAVGNYKGAVSILPKLMWLCKHEPASLMRTEHVLLGAHGFLAWRICGMAVCDPTCASTTGLVDASADEWRWADDVINLALRSNGDGVDVAARVVAALPTLVAADTVVGNVPDSTLRDLGLEGVVDVGGCKVLCGAGDLACTTVGAGAGVVGGRYAYVGTSGWAALTVPSGGGGGSARVSGRREMTGRVGSFVLGHPDPACSIVAAPVTVAGGNIAWFKRVLSSTGIHLTTASAEVSPTASSREGTTAAGVSFDWLEEKAAEAGKGCKGLVYMPYLSGERCPFNDPLARACFVGLDSGHTAGDMSRAVIEGVAFGLKALLDVLGGMGTEIEILTLVGGGARSQVLCQAVADILQVTVHVPIDPQAAAAIGCALIAAKALGWCESLQSTEPNDEKKGRMFHPDPTTAEMYSALYKVHQSLHPLLKQAFADLATVRKRHF